MKVVISDTGPILHLIEADALEVLRHLGEIWIPPEVNQEVIAYEPGWVANRPSWIQVERLHVPFDTDASNWWQSGLLDKGEAQAQALAKQLLADWLLTDDAAARLFAKTLQLEAHGSLGVILWVAAQGLIAKDVAEQKLQRLSESSLWISEKALAEARQALAQLTGS